MNPKILLVDDDEVVRWSLGKILEQSDFDVTMASNVTEALKYISSETFDVLLSDLHMPGAGDGLTVVSAMRHSNPKAITMLFSAFPDTDAATHAILLQADEILVKPMNVIALVESIKMRLASGAPSLRVVETVAAILERSIPATIHEWFKRVLTDEKLMSVSMTYDQRCGHLPELFLDLVHRLRSSKPIGSKELVSASAAQHG